MARASRRRAAAVTREHPDRSPVPPLGVLPVPAPGWAGSRGAGSEVVVHRYEGARHWSAEQGSPGHDPGVAVLARDRVVAQLGVTAG